jgi:Fur family transcriptional regulator, ferric uptake regulator
VTPALSTYVHTTVADRLGRLSQRYTSNRRLLVTLLERAGRPLSIPDILARQRTLPQSSVYRNLTVLEQAGAVRRVVADDEFARYELAEDLTRHHHHLICSNCGKVEDVTISSELETRMSRSLSRVAKREQFSTAAHRLDLIGTCRNCA